MYIKTQKTGFCCDNCDDDTVHIIYLREGILYLCDECVDRLLDILTKKGNEGDWAWIIMKLLV